MNQECVRIIGGKWRGRKLKFAAVEGLRPTQDRIRETLFNWLMQDIVDANCLDLFAGSGALGLEALSRGAQAVTFIDSNAKACRFIKNNAEQLNAEHAVVLHGAYQDFDGTSLQAPYDIIFLDPPFRANMLDNAIIWLEQNKLFNVKAKIYIEVEAGGLCANLPSNWHCSRHKSTSTLDYYLFERL